MEDDKRNDPAELEEEDEDEYEDEEDYTFEDDEEEVKAFTESFDAYFTPERWRALSEERDRRAAENKSGEPGDTAQDG